MSIASSILESPLDLSAAAVTEPSPGNLVAASVMTQERAALAAAFGMMAVALLAHIWRAHRQSPVSALYPWGLMAPVFAVISVVVGFSSVTKSFDARARVATVVSRLGPLRYSQRITLPAQGTILLHARRQLPSRASGGTVATSTVQYIVDVVGLPALGFIAYDPQTARAVARRLSAVLGYPLVDRSGDDYSPSAVPEDSR